MEQSWFDLDRTDLMEQDVSNSKWWGCFKKSMRCYALVFVAIIW